MRQLQGINFQDTICMEFHCIIYSNIFHVTVHGENIKNSS